MKKWSVILSLLIVGGFLFHKGGIEGFLLKFPSEKLPPLGQEFQKQWANHHWLLPLTESLPVEWKEVGSMKLAPLVGPVKEWMPHLKPPQIFSKGKLVLEVFFMSWKEKEEVYVIVQYDLVDPVTHELFWESSWTFRLRP